MKNITVYLGSSGHARPVFFEAAQSLGTLIAQQKKSLIYGGMDAGLMGVLARAALNAGTHVTGVIPKSLQDSERVQKSLSETIFVNDLWERKRQLFLRGDVLVTLPGGFGTLDEMMEVLYWAGLRLHQKPSILVNIDGYWDDIIALLPALPDFDPASLQIANSVEDAVSMLDQLIPDSATPAAVLPHFEDEITRQTQEPLIFTEITTRNIYYAACALGLRQLNRHQRPVGFLNDRGQFDLLLKWFEKARHEAFITPKCLSLFEVAESREFLGKKLRAQQDILINLHLDKWGKSVT
ncbi:MAG: TIGR00730 family Rossman fold protein [Alphaproteobacteria bacterium]|nr:TIGR00730 family Rossman fold protein [Alphaproteobacteria bacterium]